MLKLVVLALSFVLPAAVLVGSVPADAGSTGMQPDAKIAKRKSGRYVGGGVFNEQADGVVVRNLVPGEKGQYFLKVKNVGTAAGSLVLTGPDDGANTNFEWFRGKHRITSNVQAAGFEFALAQGQTKLFRVVVKINPDANPFGGSNLNLFQDLDDTDSDGVRSAYEVGA